MMTVTPLIKILAQKLRAEFPHSTEFKKKLIVDTAISLGIPEWEYKKLIQEDRRVRWGIFTLEDIIMNLPPFDDNNIAPATPATPATPVIPTSLQNVASIVPMHHHHDKQTTEMPVPSNHSFLSEAVAYIPNKDPLFVPWGDYTSIKKIIGSNQFFPVYISGLSGSGKTQMIKYICACQNRKYIRVQISSDTDETDLIGGWSLINGSTQWTDGPVIVAAKTGAILLIDEIDRAGPNIMCLQGILEGEPVLIKKTGELVKPVPGFNIIATGNTKGKGSESGRYVSARILDEALLERFVVSFTHDFPKEAVIQKILMAHVNNIKEKNEEFISDASVFAKELAGWGNIIHASFEQSAVDEMISIRRLVHIFRTFMIFNNQIKSIKLGIAKFDEVTQEAFIDLYKKVSSIKFDSDNKSASDNDEENELEDN